MQDNQAINKARALYYNLFANFFVESSKSENYFELLRLIKILLFSCVINFNYVFVEYKDNLISGITKENFIIFSFLLIILLLLVGETHNDLNGSP